ncbi:hypothetical protein FAZ19_20770 [Sphingobacterium alkalisoli]|uniref:DUF3575 domain-containing protein n=1 Tax=Sphingobacterium alkalisoli TaxID=1874115 RepID=A0A4U0GU50_9SPHI|nr:hypothetical protein [Sphingobacterium alkalisoli]TJY62487.1 hypothetical protein FAZ19_20770 [Sphingobacterium alkalisoli]GGH29186.1 hypothetical protein GCM10011418_40270 [Sphingobacterium alkalisoli]
MNTYTFFFVLCLLYSHLTIAQENTRPYKKIRAGYELNIGGFTDQYTAVNPSGTVHYLIHPQLWTGLRAGFRHLFSDPAYKEKDLQSKNIFINEEIKGIATISLRYYFSDKKISPLLEGRLGLQQGIRSEQVQLATGGLLGCAFKFPFGGIIHFGYQTELLNYNSLTYRTDGTGYTVYRVIGDLPIKRMSHGGFINFTFN